MNRANKMTNTRLVFSTFYGVIFFSIRWIVFSFLPFPPRFSHSTPCYLSKTCFYDLVMFFVSFAGNWINVPPLLLLSVSITLNFGPNLYWRENSPSVNIRLKKKTAIFLNSTTSGAHPWNLAGSHKNSITLGDIRNFSHTPEYMNSFKNTIQWMSLKLNGFLPSSFDGFPSNSIEIIPCPALVLEIETAGSRRWICHQLFPVDGSNYGQVKMFGSQVIGKIHDEKTRVIQENEQIISNLSRINGIRKPWKSDTIN